MLLNVLLNTILRTKGFSELFNFSMQARFIILTTVVNYPALIFGGAPTGRQTRVLLFF